MARVLSDESFAPAATIFLFADSAESAVAFLDGDGELTHVDDTFLDLWDFGDEQEALEVYFEQLWQEEQEARSALEEWRSGGEWQGQLTAIRTDGSARDVHVMARIAKNEEGLAVSPIITCFDVTERKVLEAEASKLVKELGAGVDLKYFLRGRSAIRRVGVNFGAPGDRKAENGTLWLEWPTNEGPSPRIRLEMLPEDSRIFTHHSSWLQGDGPKWVVASGVLGVSDFKLWMADERQVGEAAETRAYDVSLYFAEPEDLGPGQRIFDIKIQDESVLENFDISKEAGGARKAIVKSFEGIMVKDELRVSLASSEGSPVGEPVICGIEVIASD
jgi:hypothetical protein